MINAEQNKSRVASKYIRWNKEKVVRAREGGRGNNKTATCLEASLLNWPASH